MEPFRGEAELHRAQQYGNEDGDRSHPGEVVAEEAVVGAPAAEIGIEGRQAGEAMDGVDAGEAELGAQEARMDLGGVVCREKLPDERLPLRPCHGRVVGVARQEALLMGDEEVALRGY